MVILSCRDDQGYELLLCDVDGVGDVAVQHAVIGGGSGTRGPGVSRCGCREGGAAFAEGLGEGVAEPLVVGLQLADALCGDLDAA